MARLRTRLPTEPDQADQPDLEMLTQAQFMVGIYAEIVAMDQTIFERVRQLLARQSNNGDREATLSNLRLMLVQLEKVGERIAFWNHRVEALVEDHSPHSST